MTGLNLVEGSNLESVNKSESSAENVVEDNTELCKVRTTAGTSTKQDGVSSCRNSNGNNKDTHAFCPFVHWSQSKTHVTLRVNLVEATDFETNLQNNSEFTFSAKGKGAQGLKDYKFSLHFYDKVEVETIQPVERYLLVLIWKKEHSKWPRLTKEPVKFPWLRIDFDLFEGDDSDDSDNSETASKTENQQSLDRLLSDLRDSDKTFNKRTNTSSSWKEKLKDNKANLDIFNPFNKRLKNSKSPNMKYDYRKDVKTVDNSKNTARQALDFKKTYLFLYNVMMFIMFLKVYIVLAIKGLSGTIDDDVVQGAAFIIKLLTYTQLLETVHPILGLVPGGPFMPFLQVIGRLLVNHFLSEPAIRIDASPYAHSLFIVWSSIEIIRYSFYALRVFKVNIYALTWCRYSLFLPLYPMGGFCESMVLFSTIKYYGKTGQYSYSLPNSLNISFSLPFALKIYIFLLLGPSIYSLMKYMWRQRCKQLKEKVA